MRVTSGTASGLVPIAVASAFLHAQSLRSGIFTMASLTSCEAREPLFHRPEFGTTRSRSEAMTTEDFWEVGASWRGYGRADILDILVPADR